MAHKMNILPTRTYKTEANAIKDAEKVEWDIRYFIMQNDMGRYFPVFVGQEAVQHGLHFQYNIIA